MLQLLSARTGIAEIGDTWRTNILITDKDGLQAWADSVTMNVTKPDLTIAAATIEQRPQIGFYLVTFTLATAGRYTAVLTVSSVTFGNDVENLAVEALAGGIALPTLGEVKAYLNSASGVDVAGLFTDAVLTEALDAEKAAQSRACRIPSEYPKDLREGLLRRVARNLAMRGLPLAVPQGDAETGPIFIPGRDPEVRRLEAPWRRLKTG